MAKCNPALGVMLVLWLSGCGFDDSYDPNEQVYTGNDAKGMICKLASRLARFDEHSDGLPASAKNFWLFDGGSFGGLITYWMFDCENRDECLKAVLCLGDLRPDELGPWGPSRYAVVMGGLDFYSKRGLPWKALRSNPWDIRGIKNGLVYEWVSEDHQRMVYYAIDLDRNRVYHHYESGGFPPDEYRPDPDRGQSKAQRH